MVRGLGCSFEEGGRGIEGGVSMSKGWERERSSGKRGQLFRVWTSREFLEGELWFVGRGLGVSVTLYSKDYSHP